MILPPKNLRRCGKDYREDDANYARLSLIEADRVLKQKHKKILDIGCGTGRLYMALQEKGWRGEYVGVDPDEIPINWATAAFPEVTFRRMNFYNKRFNPTGTIYPYEWKFPKNEKYDFVYMYAIFLHMTLDDIICYLINIYEVLAKGGKFFFTIYAEPNVEIININAPNYPPGYGIENSPLHHVRYNEDFLKKVLALLNFKILDITKEWNSQTGYLVEK